MTAKRRSDDSFYDDLAPVYHLKVDWTNRHAKERKLLDYLTAVPRPAAVLDLGCGDGGHAPVFTNLGISYVGVDSSAEMIAIARSLHASPQARFEQADFLKLPREWQGAFDLCALLGNTLPHLHTARELNRLLESVARVLSPLGRFAVQTVNPGILAGKSAHFLAPKLAEGKTLFAPLYINRGRLWDFHMLIHNINDGHIVSRQVITTRLHFWSKTEILTAARAAGFSLKAAFGGADLSDYESKRSENLILVFARK